jgi:hypothetical protein
MGDAPLLGRRWNEAAEIQSSARPDRTGRAEPCAARTPINFMVSFSDSLSPPPLYYMCYGSINRSPYYPLLLDIYDSLPY